MTDAKSFHAAIANVPPTKNSVQVAACLLIAWLVEREEETQVTFNKVLSQEPDTDALEP